MKFTPEPWKLEPTWGSVLITGPRAENGGEEVAEVRFQVNPSENGLGVYDEPTALANAQLLVRSGRMFRILVDFANNRPGAYGAARELVAELVKEELT